MTVSVEKGVTAAQYGDQSMGASKGKYCESVDYSFEARG
jgi:hypothetical protein